MKKMIYILPLLLLLGCTKDNIMGPEPYTELPMDIFEVQNTVVKDGDIANINLDSNGTYKISIVDEFTNTTFTNEKFIGNQGSNRIRIYTKALPKGSYKLYIKTDNDGVIKQTTIKL